MSALMSQRKQERLEKQMDDARSTKEKTQRDYQREVQEKRETCSPSSSVGAQVPKRTFTDILVVFETEGLEICCL